MSYPYHYVEKIEDGNDLHLKLFLINSNINLKNWGVYEHTIEEKLPTAIGIPTTLWFNPKIKQFDHPYVANASKEFNDAFQQSASIGPVVDTTKQLNKINLSKDYFGISNIINKDAKEFLLSLKMTKVPLYTSPQVRHKHWDITPPYTDWYFDHVAIVNSPAYGIQTAEIKDTCIGSTGNCVLALKKSVLEEEPIAANASIQSFEERLLAESQLMCKKTALGILVEQGFSSIVENATIDFNNIKLSAENTNDSNSSATKQAPQNNNNNNTSGQPAQQQQPSQSGSPIFNIGLPQGWSASPQNTIPGSTVQTFYAAPIDQKNDLASKPNIDLTKGQAYNNNNNGEQQSPPSVVVTETDSEKAKMAEELANAKKEIAEMKHRQTIEDLTKIVPQDLYVDSSGRFQQKAYYERIDEIIKSKIPLEEVAKFYAEGARLAEIQASKNSNKKEEAPLLVKNASTATKYEVPGFESPAVSASSEGETVNDDEEEEAEDEVKSASTNTNPATATVDFSNVKTNNQNPNNIYYFLRAMGTFRELR